MKLHSAVTAIILAATVFLFPQKASAQWEVRFGIDGYPLIANCYYGSMNNYSSWHDYDGASVNRMYGDYDRNVYSTGTMSLEINYILKDWLNLSMDLGYNHIWSDRYDGLDDTFKGHRNANVFYMVPEARFTYIHHPLLKLYSSAGFGIGFYDNFKKLDSYVMPECQLVPIGLMFGRKFFGFAEFGFGTVYFGLKAGIGYRF